MATKKRRRKRGPEPIYDWRAIFGNPKHVTVLTRGIDFKCTISSMRVMLYVRAEKAGIKISTRLVTINRKSSIVVTNLGDSR